MNPIALMGNTEAFALWGQDPVHPSELAYQKMAREISGDISCQRTAAPRSTLSAKPHPDNRTGVPGPSPRENYSMWPAGEGDGQTNRFPQEPEDPSVATTPGEAAEAATAEATNHTS